MKPQHQIAAYMGLLGMTVLIAILVSIRDRLIAIGPWVLGVLLALCGLVMLYYLHKLYVLFRTDRLRLAERVYEVEGKRQALTIEQERWEVERASILLGQHLQTARIYPDAKGYMPTLINVAPEGDYQYIHLPHPAHQTRLHGGQQPMLPTQAESRQQEGLPTNVRYEDIKHLIPQGHILVGIGLEGVETKPQAVGACLWIVGLSGTGKTSTTVLRVEERKQAGHSFLGADPHWFKDDSLFHAVFETLDGQPGPYADRFLLPMAKTPEEMLAVLNAFLAEFQARKAGQRQKPWRKITLLIDEVGSSMDKAMATTSEEKAIIELLPSIARICGQEARNFNMGGIFISQQATGVAWLRKVALMVIVHQLHQESEKKLATNNDPKVMEEMKYWPIGRTYTFGVGFGQEGPRTVQQPYFKPTVVESTAVIECDEMETLQPKKQTSIFDAPIYRPGSAFLSNRDERSTETATRNANETAREADTEPSNILAFRVSAQPESLSVEKKDAPVSGVSDETKKIILRMHNNRMPMRDIARMVGLSGEKYSLFKLACQELNISTQQQAAEQ